MSDLSKQLVTEYFMSMAKNRALRKQATRYRREIERLDVELEDRQTTTHHNVRIDGKEI